MWKRLLEFGSRLITVSQKLQQHDEDVKQLRQDIKQLSQRVDQLSEALQRALFELQRTQERSETAHRILLLEVKNELLRFERRLPPGRVKEDDEQGD